jgi:hypothetical protein
LSRFAELRCCRCGGASLLTLFSPGSSPVIDVLTDIMLDAGRPASATCSGCWAPGGGELALGGGEALSPKDRARARGHRRPVVVREDPALDLGGPVA